MTTWMMGEMTRMMGGRGETSWKRTGNQRRRRRGEMSSRRRGEKNKMRICRHRVRPNDEAYGPTMMRTAQRRSIRPSDNVSGPTTTRRTER